MKILLLPLVIVMISVMLFSSQIVAAVTPLDLTGVNKFAILANTYTNSGAGTVLNGDLGYTTAPATPPTVNGATIGPGPAYTTAETIQAGLITSANAETCTTSITAATDLSSLPPIVPGVYCFTGAISITGTLTLSGGGVYIFRTDGALDAAAGSTVTLSGGTKADNVFWVPAGATTLGAGSTFAGNILSDAAITLLDHVSMNGRILSHGAVTTTGPSDTISPPPSISVSPHTVAIGGTLTVSGIGFPHTTTLFVFLDTVPPSVVPLHSVDTVTTDGGTFTIDFPVLPLYASPGPHVIFVSLSPDGSSPLTDPVFVLLTPSSSIPEFPFPFSLVIIFVAITAVYMGIRQKMTTNFKRF